MNYTHQCEHCGRVVVTSKSLFACSCIVAPKLGPLWIELHRYPVEHYRDWDAVAAQYWFAGWQGRVPSFGCDCGSNFAVYCAANPPDFSGPVEFFAWGYRAHDYVSANHSQRPRITYQQAYELYWPNRIS